MTKSHKGWKQYEGGVAKTYCELRDRHENPGRQLLRKFVDSLMPDWRYRGYAREGHSLLDVGCGDGLDLVFYHKEHKSLDAHGLWVYGIEPCRTMAKLAERRLQSERMRNTVFEGSWDDFSQVREEKRGFDVVTACFSLHHATDLVAAFRNVYSCLHRGGHFAFVVPALAPTVDQRVVNASLFGGELTVRYPVRTVQAWYEAIDRSVSERCVWKSVDEMESPPGKWKWVHHTTFSMSGDENGEKDGWFVVLKKLRW